MEQDSPWSVEGTDLLARDAVTTVLGIESKLDQLSEQLIRIASRDRNMRANHPLAGFLAGVKTSERRAVENFHQFSDGLDALGEKFAKGLDGFLRNPEDGPGERQFETAVQNFVGDAAPWSRASIQGDRPFDPLVSHLENPIADPASRIAGHEATQGDLREFVQG